MNHPAHTFARPLVAHARRFALAAIASLIVSATASTATATVLYQQNFNPDINERDVATWASKAISLPAVGVQTYPAWASYVAGTGMVTPNLKIQAAGSTYHQIPTGGQFVFEGTDVSVDLTAWQNITIQVDTVQGSSSGHFQFLIQLDGDDWYVSNTIITPVTASSLAAGGTAATVTLPFSTAAANWSSFTMGSAEVNGVDITPMTDALPSDASITGLGFYYYSTSGSVIQRLDNLIITGTAIPEPATYAALAGALSLGGVIALRRRRGAGMRGDAGSPFSGL